MSFKFFRIFITLALFSLTSIVSLNVGDLCCLSKAQAQEGEKLIAGELQRRESLSLALKKNGLNPSKARPAIQALSKVFEFRTSRAGDHYEALIDASGELQALLYSKGNKTYIARRSEEGFVASEANGLRLGSPTPSPDIKDEPVEAQPPAADPIEPAELEPQTEPKDDSVPAEAEPPHNAFAQPEEVQPTNDLPPQVDPTPAPAQKVKHTEVGEPKPHQLESSSRTASYGPLEFILIAMAGLLVLMVGWLIWSQQRNGQAADTPEIEGFEHLRSLKVGPNHHVAVLEFQGRTYLIGLSPERVSLLTPLDKNGDPILALDGPEAATVHELLNSPDAKALQLKKVKAAKKDSIPEVTWTGDPRAVFEEGGAPPEPPLDDPPVKPVVKVDVIEETASQTDTDEVRLTTPKLRNADRPRTLPEEAPTTSTQKSSDKGRESEAILARIAALRARHVKND